MDEPEMPTHEQRIIEALEARRIAVAPFEGTLNVSFGEGLNAQRCNLDIRPFIHTLSAGVPDEARRIASFTSGVEAVLLEPGRSRAQEWTYERCAGRIMPILEGPGFEDGVVAASGGDDAFTLPFDDELVLAFFIELDRGRRALRHSQVDAWGVSSERIRSAARSMLYHRTERARRSEVENGVWRLHAGDGLDAARAIVFADAFYSDIGAGLRFSIPTQHHFLYVLNESGVDALKDVAHRVYGASSYPLTTRVFRFEHGLPVPAEH